jgi:hypothetical protein
MTANRKADLQRKLALAPVPKPPADLADRIKAEIPKQFDVNRERARFRQAVSFNVRVAASIILLVSSVYLALHLLSRRFGPPPEATATMAASAKNDTGPIVMPSAPPPAVSTEATVTRNQPVIAEARPAPPAGRVMAAPQAAAPAAASADNAAGGYAAPAAVAQPVESEEELMQRYARAEEPSRKTAAVTLDVEASAAPFDPAKQIVRVSLDGPHGATPDVAFNDDTVASWHTLASDGTSLYEITLRPPTGMNGIVATVRLGGVERVIRRDDLRSWDDASRRMKAASLIAAMESGVSPEVVAAKARAAGLDDVAAAARARVRR